MTIGGMLEEFKRSNGGALEELSRSTQGVLDGHKKNIRGVLGSARGVLGRTRAVQEECRNSIKGALVEHDRSTDEEEEC